MTPAIQIFIASAAAFLVSVIVTRRILDPASRLHVLDHPNERSLHTLPTPRTGGIAIFAGIVVALAIWMLSGGQLRPLHGLGVSALVLVVLSFVDDRRGLSVGLRLFGHFVVAGLPVFTGLYLTTVSLPGFVWNWPMWFGMLVSLLFIIWMINLYNFMDGMDGFASGMAVIGFGTFALLGSLSHHLYFLTINLAIAFAAAGFMIFNFPPARTFMGDTGSSLLGLLAGGVSIWGVRDGVFSFWVALLVFSPFIIDATVTLLRRLIRGERVWQAHKTHYYQRLVQLGWGHRKTVLAEYILMLACAGTSVAVYFQSPDAQCVTIAIWASIYVLLMLGVKSIERGHQRRNP